MSEVNSTKCGVCGKGDLIPVHLGKGGDRAIRYRCTNKDCNIRFDEHGYERYDENKQDWVRLEIG